MKVLVNCYACGPHEGSEAGMGWNFVRVLARIADLYVITESKFRPAIEQYYKAHPEEPAPACFYYIRKSRYIPLACKVWPPSYYWLYRRWQKKAYRLACGLEAKTHFDLVHQLNMVGYREPGYLWKLNIPFVWGPVGGFQIIPWRMLPSLGLYGCAFHAVRNLMNLFQMRTSRRVKAAMHKACGLMASTQGNLGTMERLYHKENVLLCPEVGLEETTLGFVRSRIPGAKLKLCWSGVHVPRKALNLLLEALRGGDLMEKTELHVLGQGRETAHWKELARRYGLTNVVWHAWLARDEALCIMQDCDLFCITSLSDETSTVLLEALSLGLPVIAPDLCGFTNVVDETCGLKIPVRTHGQFVHDYRQAIEAFLHDEPRRRLLAEGASRHAADFKWADKAQWVASLYQGILISARKSKPSILPG
ncbi:MAG: glycosyltransferase [Tannerella sp.]|jgi:glycosyltransferase involved in cell wall biosynthesis|nr:glycosyltransferase [Tannerella sp.]